MEDWIIRQSPKNFNYQYLAVTDASRYSSLLPHHIQNVRQILTTRLKYIRFDHIIDCTAHIGCDSILFRLLYPHKNIIAIENDADTYNKLEQNMNNLALITNNDRVKPIITVHDDCIHYLFNHTLTDAVCYFDPPWLNINYKDQTTVDLYLSGQSISQIINDVKLYKRPALIIVKLPYNFNFESFEAFNVVYDTVYTNKGKISYILAFIG